MTVFHAVALLSPIVAEVFFQRDKVILADSVQLMVSRHAPLSRIAGPLQYRVTGTSGSSQLVLWSCCDRLRGDNSVTYCGTCKQCEYRLQSRSFFLFSLLLLLINTSRIQQLLAVYRTTFSFNLSYYQPFFVLICTGFIKTKHNLYTDPSFFY